MLKGLFQRAIDGLEQVASCKSQVASRKSQVAHSERDLGERSVRVPERCRLVADALCSSLDSSRGQRKRETRRATLAPELRVADGPSFVTIAASKLNKIAMPAD